VEKEVEEREEMEIQRQIAPTDEWMRFLEGKLMAFRLVGEHFQKGEGSE
jgi:hypothetical protein